MDITPTPLAGVFVIRPKVFRDERGYFMESFRWDRLTAGAGLKEVFVQDNESLSQKGVLRGLHFQKPPFAQGKLVRVVTGSVFDVAVDLRKDSDTYGKWFGQTLTADQKEMLWIPPGFAHGFLTLEDNTIFQYKCTQYYHPESEGSIRWDDPSIGIQWPLEDISSPVVSAKDASAPAFNAFISPF
ncbi:MAG: dTDP-4-dehydrorhamnose 3,5-epimerase [Bacteroidales bacterium]